MTLSLSAPLRDQARQIFAAALAAVDPQVAVRNHLHWDGHQLCCDALSLPLGNGGRIFVVAVGKAAAAMAAAAEEILGPRLYAGLVVTKDGHGQPLQVCQLLEASHPLPDDRGVAAAAAVERLLTATTAADLVLCLLSGGASALLPAPVAGMALEEKIQLTRDLLASGASIDEINCVRKHLSRLKGGGLLRAAAPARCLALILSDVVGDPLDVIASGPTVADPTTYADAWALLERYQLLARLPAGCRDHLLAGCRGQRPETLKPGDPLLQRVANQLIGSNRLAVQAAAACARALGWTPLILTTSLEGETRPVAAMHAAIAREIRHSGQPLAPPVALLSGGETTVTLDSRSGKGGRNQEFALAAAVALAGMAEVLVLSGGTDGTDGPTDAAGALADGTSVARAAALGLSARHHLERHDAYPLFAALDDLLLTGPTQTNVMDLHLLLVR